MNQQELQELQEYIEELKRDAYVGFVEALEEIMEYYYNGFKDACEIILDKIKRLEEEE